MDAPAIALQLGVEPTTGLSGEEAARRLAADGRNELRGKKLVPVWRTVTCIFFPVPSAPRQRRSAESGSLC
jgi:hypothetical protein